MITYLITYSAIGYRSAVTKQSRYFSGSCSLIVTFCAIEIRYIGDSDRTCIGNLWLVRLRRHASVWMKVSLFYEVVLFLSGCKVRISPKTFSLSLFHQYRCAIWAMKTQAKISWCFVFPPFLYFSLFRFLLTAGVKKKTQRKCAMGKWKAVGLIPSSVGEQFPLPN